MSLSHQVMPAPQSYLTYLRQAHHHGLIAGHYQYHYEFALLLTALNDLEARLPQVSHASYAPLHQILHDSAQLTFEINNMPLAGDFHSTKIDKIAALRKTVSQATLVARQPFDVETSNALMESVHKMRNVTEGSFFFRNRTQQALAAILLASIMLVTIGIMAMGSMLVAPVIGLAMMLATEPFVYLNEDTQKDICARNIDEQAVMLNKSCLFNHPHQEQQAAQQAPANDRRGFNLG